MCWIVFLTFKTKEDNIPYESLCHMSRIHLLADFDVDSAIAAVMLTIRVPNLAVCPGRLQRPEHPLNLLDWNRLKRSEINWRWSGNSFLFLRGIWRAAFVQSPSWMTCVCSLTDQSALWAGSFVYSRKPVLSAESEAKAKAIAEKNGALVAKNKKCWLHGFSMDFRIVRMTSSVAIRCNKQFWFQHFRCTEHKLRTGVVAAWT